MKSSKWVIATVFVVLVIGGIIAVATGFGGLVDDCREDSYLSVTLVNQEMEDEIVPQDVTPADPNESLDSPIVKKAIVEAHESEWEDIKNLSCEQKQSIRNDLGEGSNHHRGRWFFNYRNETFEAIWFTNL